MRTLTQRLEDLAACLCAQIIEDGNGDLCFCGLMPGSEVAFEYLTSTDCSACGMAYVQLDVAGPVRGIGIENVEVNNCSSLIGFSAEIGIIRCITSGDADGTPPSQEELSAAALIQYADIKTMIKAVQCCNPKPYILGQYQPYGPVGGAMGGTFPITMLEE